MEAAAGLREGWAALHEAREQRAHARPNRRGLGHALRWLLGFGPMLVQGSWMLSWFDRPPRELSELLQLIALVSFVACTAGALIVHADVARRRRRTALIAVGASTAVVLVHAPWLGFFGPSFVAALFVVVIVLFQAAGQVLDTLFALVLLATPVAFSAVHMRDVLRSLRVLRRPALGFRDAAWLLAGLVPTYVAGLVSFSAAWSFAW